MLRRPRELLRDRAQLLDQLTDRLGNAMQKVLTEKQQRLNMADKKLNLLNPWGVLQRGYSVVRRPNGDIISTAESVNSGETLDVWLHKGRLAVQVTRVSKGRES